MKAYIILTQKQHSTEIVFEDKKFNQIPVINGTVTAKKINWIDKLTKSVHKKHITVFFSKKSAISSIIDKGINDSILRAFQSAKFRKIVESHQLKSFFFIKASNIILNTRKKVFSCTIDAETEKTIIIENGIKYAEKAIKIKPIKVSPIQMRDYMTMSTPGVKTIIEDILNINKEIFEGLTKEAKEIATQLKYGLKEIPLNQIKTIDVLIEAAKISKEIEKS